jgi:hypothetical protein
MWGSQVFCIALVTAATSGAFLRSLTSDETLSQTRNLETSTQSNAVYTAIIEDAATIEKRGGLLSAANDIDFALKRSEIGYDVDVRIVHSPSRAMEVDDANKKVRVELNQKQGDSLRARLKKTGNPKKIFFKQVKDTGRAPQPAWYGGGDKRGRIQRPRQRQTHSVIEDETKPRDAEGHKARQRRPATSKMKTLTITETIISSVPIQTPIEEDTKSSSIDLPPQHKHPAYRFRLDSVYLSPFITSQKAAQTSQSAFAKTGAETRPTEISVASPAYQKWAAPAQPSSLAYDVSYSTVSRTGGGGRPRLQTAAPNQAYQESGKAAYQQQSGPLPTPWPDQYGEAQRSEEPFLSSIKFPSFSNAKPSVTGEPLATASGILAWSAVDYRMNDTHALRTNVSMAESRYLVENDDEDEDSSGGSRDAGPAGWVPPVASSPSRAGSGGARGREAWDNRDAHQNWPPQQPSVEDYRASHQYEPVYHGGNGQSQSIYPGHPQHLHDPRYGQTTREDWQHPHPPQPHGQPRYNGWPASGNWADLNGEYPHSRQDLPLPQPMYPVPGARWSHRPWVLADGDPRLMNEGRDTRHLSPMSQSEQFDPAYSIPFDHAAEMEIPPRSQNHKANLLPRPVSRNNVANRARLPSLSEDGQRDFPYHVQEPSPYPPPENWRPTDSQKDFRHYQPPPYLPPPKDLPHGKWQIQPRSYFGHDPVIHGPRDEGILTDDYQETDDENDSQEGRSDSVLVLDTSSPVLALP